MNKIIPIMAGIVAISASPALAAGDTKEYPVTASVAAKCTAQTGSTNELDFGALTTNADGTLSGSYTKSFSKAAFVCNGAATTIDATATPMTNAVTPTSSDFTDTINYGVKIELGDYTGTFETTGSGIAGATLGEQAGTLKVTADSLAPASSKALIAGDYTGAITITITPAA